MCDCREHELSRVCQQLPWLLWAGLPHGGAVGTPPSQLTQRPPSGKSRWGMLKHTINYGVVFPRKELAVVAVVWVLCRRSCAGDVSQMGLVVKGTSHAGTGNARGMGITHCTPGEQGREPGTEGIISGRDRGRLGLSGLWTWVSSLTMKILFSPAKKSRISTDSSLRNLARPQLRVRALCLCWKEHFEHCLSLPAAFCPSVSLASLTFLAVSLRTSMS